MPDGSRLRGLVSTAGSPFLPDKPYVLEPETAKIRSTS